MRLSAHEWDEQDILGRQDILARLRCSEDNTEASVEERRRPMRPPILMVPMDTSDLVSIVQNWEHDNSPSNTFSHETAFSSLQVSNTLGITYYMYLVARCKHFYKSIFG